MKESLEVSLGFCSSAIYIYITPQKYSLYKASFTVFSKYLPSPCNSILETPYTKCGRYSSEECSSTCHEDCVYVGCVARDQAEDRFGLCLPGDLSSQEYLMRCQMDRNVTTYNLVDPCQEEKGEEKSTFHVILIIIFVALTILLVAAVHYRYKLIATEQPPYQVPNFMPEWLFPRSLNRSNR